MPGAPAAAGAAPELCTEALVTSVFPTNVEGTQSQRTRWEHGHLGVILSDAPTLLGESIRRSNWSLLAMTLDLLVPPLALLTLLTVAGFVMTWLWFALSGLLLPALIASSGVALLGATVLLAWAKFGREVISFATLLYAPFYALKKIPLYVSFLFKRQVDWVRSKRDDS